MWHFDRMTPADLMIDSRGILAFLDAMEHYDICMHSLMVIRHGKVAAEGFWAPYARGKTHTLFSASKTFTSLAVGFAIQEGYLTLDSLVLPYFREHLDGADPCPNMARITVRHLLTMTAGFERDPHDFPFDDRTDWIENFLSAYVPYTPGTRFVYSTHSSYMLSALVQETTGMTVWEYLRERLFEPLGFEGEWWESSPQGVSVGGWGLMITTEDYAKLGQFLLQEGRWNGEQLLDAAYVRAATACQVSTSHNPCPTPLDAPDQQSGYGYQIWRNRTGNAYMASGGFGQYTIVMPERDAVVTMTCGTHSDGLFHSLWEYLYPAILPEGEALDPQIAAEADKALAQRLAALQIPYPVGSEPHNRAVESEYTGVRYAFSENAYGFTAVTFDYTGETPRVQWEMEDRSFAVSIGYREWIDGRTCVETEETDTDLSVIYQDVSCAGAWDQDVYVLRMVYDHTPFYDTFRFTFRGAALQVDAHRSIWHYGEHLPEVLYGCHIG